MGAPLHEVFRSLLNQGGDTHPGKPELLDTQGGGGELQVHPPDVPSQLATASRFGDVELRPDIAIVGRRTVFLRTSPLALNRVGLVPTWGVYPSDKQTTSDRNQVLLP